MRVCRAGSSSDVVFDVGAGSTASGSRAPTGRAVFYMRTANATSPHRSASIVSGDDGSVGTGHSSRALFEEEYIDRGIGVGRSYQARIPKMARSEPVPPHRACKPGEGKVSGGKMWPASSGAQLERRSQRLRCIMFRFMPTGLYLVLVSFP